MTKDLALTINSHDYKGLVRSGSDNYQTTRKAIYGAKYTDLDGVDHVTLLRYRGGLKVNLMAMSPTTAASLLADLESQPITVTYFCLQTNTTTTEEMTLESTTLSDALKRSDGHWVQQTSLTFSQL